MCLLTSVPEACFRHFGRKFRALYPCGLPYQGPVFGILDGSFMIHALADFRTQGLFSAFCTEVSCPVPLLTSVPKACFLCFGRKFSAQPAYRLPSQGSVFGVLDGSFGHAKGQDFLPRPCVCSYPGSGCPFTGIYPAPSHILDISSALKYLRFLLLPLPCSHFAVP